MKLSTLFKDNTVFANKQIRAFGVGNGAVTAEIAGNKAKGGFCERANGAEKDRLRFYSMQDRV